MTNMPLQITNFFLAMQAGPSGLERLGALFSDDAEYVEPFSGNKEPHRGRTAILKAFDESRTDEFDDAVIHLGAVELDGDQVVVDWTCISKAIPGGSGSGKNLFELRDGKIQRLTTTLDQE